MNINPQLLLHRLIALKDKYDDTVTLFLYKLFRHRSALFDDSGLPREASKHQVTDATWDIISNVQTELPEDTLQYVIDGDALDNMV